MVWDPSAQRQILRILFLPDDIARKWTNDERAILQLDSRMRNLRATLNREERDFSSNEAKATTSPDIRAALKSLEALQQNDTQSREQLEDELLEIETARHNARLRVLRAEQEQEARYRKVERSKLLAISAHFPTLSETARYIMAQLLTQHECLVCGHHVPDITAEYRDRIEHRQCVICGSDLSSVNGSANGKTAASDIDMKQAVIELDKINDELLGAHKALEVAESSYRSHIEQMTELARDINDRSSRIDFLVRQLPPQESAMHTQRSELVAMRGRLERLQGELDSLRRDFRMFVERLMYSIVEYSARIKKEFNFYAKGFLLEQCQLLWAPHRATIGQGGMLLSFRLSNLICTGADFPSPVRRRGPEQVSESQREFIDLLSAWR